MTLSRKDAARLSALRDAHELAELEILTKTSDEITSMDVQSLTIGQMLIFGDLMAARSNIQAISDRQRAKSRFSKLLGNAETETRGFPGGQSGRFGYGKNEGADDYGNDPFGLSDEARTNGAETADDEARAAEARAFFNNLFSSDPVMKTVNGTIRASEIPRDASGVPDAAWIDENCTCDEHAQKRDVQRLTERANELRRDSEPPSFGQYV